MPRKRTITPPTFLRNYAPLKFLLWKSCPLYNFNTVENIFIKLVQIKTTIRRCAENKNRNSTYIFLKNYAPLKFLLWKSCPLYNFNTVENIFIKLVQIKTTIRRCAENKNRNSTYIFLKNYAPFENFPLKIVSALWLWYPREYFHENLYKYRLSSDDVQRKTELCPFEIFPLKIMSALKLLYRWEYFHEILYKY